MLRACRAGLGCLRQSCCCCCCCSLCRQPAIWQRATFCTPAESSWLQKLWIAQPGFLLVSPAVAPELCAECRAAGRSLHISMHSCEYHELAAREHAPAPAPTLIKPGRAAAKPAGRSRFSFSFGPPPGDSGKGRAGSAKAAAPCPAAAEAAAAQAEATGSAAADKGGRDGCGCSASSACSQHIPQQEPAQQRGAGGDGGGPAAAAAGGAGAAPEGGEGGRGWARPHAAFMCNSGLHEENEAHQTAWLPTVRWLRDAGVPTLLTAYTLREARDDARVLRRCVGCWGGRPRHQRACPTLSPHSLALCQGGGSACPALCAGCPRASSRRGLASGFWVPPPWLLAGGHTGTPGAAALCVCRLGCKLLLEPQENPFRADVPMVDCEARFAVFTVNGFSLGFQGSA